MAHDLAIVSHRGRLIRCLWLADLNISMLSLHYVIPNKISFFVMPRQARKGGWTAGTHMRASYASACIETFEGKTSFRPHRTVYWQGFFFLRKQKALSQVSALAKHRKQYGFERWLWRRQLTKQKEAGSFSGKTLIFISADFCYRFSTSETLQVLQVCDWGWKWIPSKQMGIEHKLPWTVAAWPWVSCSQVWIESARLLLFD